MGCYTLKDVKYIRSVSFWAVSTFICGSNIATIGCSLLRLHLTKEWQSMDFNC